MHFATVIIQDSKRLENWHCMSIKTDFVETLKMYGRLPISASCEQFKLLKENMQLRETLMEYKRQIRVSQVQEEAEESKSEGSDSIPSKQESKLGPTLVTENEVDPLKARLEEIMRREE